MKKRSVRAMAAVLALMLCTVFIPAKADEEETLMIHVDSVNGTRWADTMVVYRDRATTEQNEYGENVVVDASGKVIDKIPGGDIHGKNLAIPEGGMVVSGTGDKGKRMYDLIDIGDNVFFDEYGSRILASKGEINPFYEWSIKVTSYNDVRYSNTVVIYNQAGSRTGTNGYGYEVVIDRDGYVVEFGGNDSLVPAGGYVLSVIEPSDKENVRMYFIPGAHCVLKNDVVTVTYSEEMLSATTRNEINNLKSELEEAKKQLRLIDYEAVEKLIREAELKEVLTLEERDKALSELKATGRMLIESRDAEIRGTWYSPLEKNADEVRATVKQMREAGLNQLALGVDAAMLKLSKDYPYAPGKRVASFDMLGEYVKACKEEGIELLITIPVFYNTEPHFTKYLTKTNKGVIGEEKFCSPANEEYIEYFKEFLTYVITRYDIDGFQYDYIRFPYYDGQTDYGYDDAMKELFASEKGCDISVVDEIAEQLSSHPLWNEWVAFKTSVISRRVAEFSAIIRELRPDIYITAAVADYTAPAAYCQDSSVWLKEGWVDGIYPMSYAEGIMQASTIRFREYIGDSNFLVMGNGAYLSLTMDEMYRQTRDSAIYGADGIAYFEWGAYRDHGYAAQLVTDALASDALSFTASESESIKALLKTAEARFALYDSQSGEKRSEKFASLLGEHGEDAAALYNALNALYKNDTYLIQDVELAARIQRFSREEYKGTVSLLPVMDDKAETSGPPSDESEASADEEPSTASDISGAPQQSNKTGLLLGIIGGIAVVAACAVGFIAVKKKKK